MVARKLLRRQILRLKLNESVWRAYEIPFDFVLTGHWLNSARNDGWLISAGSDSGEVCLWTVIA